MATVRTRRHVQGRHLVADLCQVLGLNGVPVRRLEIIADCNQRAEVVAYIAALDDAGQRLTDVVERFHLVPADVAEHPEPPESGG